MISHFGCHGEPMEPSTTPPVHTPSSPTLSDQTHISAAAQSGFFNTLGRLYSAMTPFERVLAWSFGLIWAISSFVLAAQVSTYTSVVVPAHGGTLTEGIVGAPRFINPLLAISDADRDVSYLVFSGLLRHGENGSFIPDLASEYSINETGTEYTFTIRPDAVFHDGDPVTADDVAFTVSLAQNPDVKSPKRADWEGVVAEVVDERTVRFTLARPYGPFMENLTIGILPKHLWSDVTPEEFPFHRLNTEPIGSGPYKAAKIQKRASGSLERITLEHFDEFTLGDPFINTINIVFYASDDALITAFNTGAIDSISSIAPERVPELTRVDMNQLTSPLSRTFAVFFNQTKSEALADPAVRSALDSALDKEALIAHVLRGYGVALEGPIPREGTAMAAATLVSDTPTTSSLGTESTAADTADTASTETSSDEATTDSRLEAARAILEKAGWQVNAETGIREKKGVTLSVRIATGNAPALAATAEEIAHTWRELGAHVSVEAYNTGELNTNVIRPREYEALLFGEIVGRTLDLFAFWHSSQRTDPGLNLSLYANARADRLLSEARATADQTAREEKYAEFVQIIREDMPAAFLYAPEYIYIAPPVLRNVRLDTMTTLADRFANVHEWYVETERVWPIFTH